MRYIKELQKLQLKMNDENHSFLSYNSLTEEAVKIAIKATYMQEPIIVIKENGFMAERLKEVLMSYFALEEVALYLPEESLRVEEIASSFENRAARLKALYDILCHQPKVIITSPYGFIRHLPKKEELLGNIIKIKVDEEIDRDELIEKLKMMGYEKTSHVETPMTYAYRGYIVDVFSVNYQLPIRIEFFDNVIDSLRFFDINSQRTLENIREAEIIFAKDVFFNEEEKNYINANVTVESGEMEIALQYLNDDIFVQSQYFYRSYFENKHLRDYFDQSIVYLSDEEKTEEHLRLLANETIAYLQEMHEEKKLPLRFSVYGDFKRLLASSKMIKGAPYAKTSEFAEIDLPYGNLDYVLTIIQTEKYAKKLIILEDKEYEKTYEALKRLKIHFKEYKGNLKEGINLAKGYFYGGFSLGDFAIYSSREIFKEKRHTGRFANKYAEARTLDSYEELKPGDYVVHDQYGIGQFLSITRREVAGVTCDYLLIVYKGNDELLVPLSQFSLVRKYVSKEGVVPKLHKLGSKEWSETKHRVEENVSAIAERLVELYSLRDSNIGFAFSKDDELTAEFEDDFAYELTADQERSIREIKADMEKPKPMDRLLCGDVGFGKTEVAIRAAFKAVKDGKQVAYLCPTTILSIQHYETFLKRFAKFPVRIEVMNRYISPLHQKEVIRDLAEGKVDILIGTHRILSNDIKFKDLGLLIVDEEQRFGVEHKEKIKEYKSSIDVLSLSATPIPRTLQMSLIGVRGLSTLDTPPLNRYPVQTYIVTKSENLIEEAIMRELERKGQVFYLYNNVELIYAVASKLAKKLPYAKIGVAHGQMASEEIEDVMYRFHNNEINVLICTTIIETGLDIPNANTIIVENAQNFGLAQLYQIKGRVGRSDRVAYAYLLVPDKKQLNENGIKRLEAIKEFTALGSGYKIAMRDLTIRGAGDLLGDRQSGFIDNVGLDLYLSMLNRAIKLKKGEEVKEEEKQKINVPLSSYIPDTFSDNDYEKLNVYHELDEIKDKQELLEYYLQVADEYGRLPKEVEDVFNKKKLELLINLELIERITNRNGRFTIILTSKYSNRIDGLKLFEFCNGISRDIKIAYHQRSLELSIDNHRENIVKILKLVDNLDKLEKDENR
ncbi:MAG: transcription-repair coupling factor [Erysipelotrichaceae bacterium]|nr:transcription-repair coupling factor [Erysipelotrichaceae bacterium]